jgi:amidohydrolase
MDINKTIEELNEELIGLRRDFHQHPELGYKEYRTSKIVADYLRKMDLKVEVINKTGVVGLLDTGKPGKTIMLRADMDALPIQEMTNLDYKSVNENVMHACGHDGHTAMLLITAKVLSKIKEQLRGKIKFVFQPNEEATGSLDMINKGVLENPKADGAFAVHLWTPLKSGQIGIVAGPVMAACETFMIKVKGKGGHTSAPHEAIDPVLSACQMVQSFQNMQTRENDPRKALVIMVGKIKGGTGANIIPEDVFLEGTLRSLSVNDEEREEYKIKFERIIKAVCELNNTEYELNFHDCHPAVVNDTGLVQIVRESVHNLQEELEIIPHISMAGEDFSEFSVRVPSAFYFIGTGNKEKKSDYPHHHPLFDIDESTLKTGVELFVLNVVAFLLNSD